jgi:hypothetical protein
MAHLGSALSKVAPFMRGSVAEAIGSSAIGAIDDTGAARVLDSGHCLFVLAMTMSESWT